MKTITDALWRLLRTFLQSPLRVIYPLSVLWTMLLLALYWGYQRSPDTFTNLDAMETLAAGHLDIMRTPVYPLFLLLCKSIFGTAHFKEGAVVLQHIFFLVSIYYLWRTFKLAGLRQWVQALLLAVYAFMPGINVWSCHILPENFAIVGMVMFTYCVVRLWHEPRVSTAAWFLVWLVLLIYLRPASIYLLPVMGVAWLLFLWSRRHRAYVVALAGTLLASLSVLGYMWAYEHEYKVFAMSNVGIVNRYYMLRNGAAIDTTLIADPALRARVVASFAKWGNPPAEPVNAYEAFPFCREYGVPAVLQVVQANEAAHRGKLLRMLARRAEESSSCKLYVSELRTMSRICKVVSPDMNAMYAVVLCYAVVLLWWICRYRRVPRLAATLFMLMCSAVIVAVVGAQNGWPRLLTPSTPVLMLMVGQLCSMVSVRARSGQEMDELMN